jgi:hypothetical protein
MICVQLYEFDATSPVVLNPNSLISITGVDPATEKSFNGLSNFTIAASSNSVELGGPTNANEGIVVALSITAKPGASGTYWAEVIQGARQGLHLEDNGAREGGPNGILVAGTGQPDYVPSNVIELPLFLGGCTSAFHIQGVAYDICPDMLYYRFIAMTTG